MLRKTLAVATATLITIGAASPASAEPVHDGWTSSDVLKAIVVTPLLTSSALSSLVGIPQCTLFDTTGC